MVSNLLLQGVGMTSQRTRERLIHRLKERGITNLRVLDVMLNTPRHIFLDEALSHRAYEDTALPIGHGQTLSQPYIVARMTELLLGENSSLSKVLEIGTGSGYQASILSQLATQVFTVERIKPLQDRAREKFRQIGLRNIHCKYSDGTFGWPDNGPYDGIISTAAPQSVPSGLLDQLAPNGVLVIPVGGREQFLQLIRRNGDNNEFITSIIEPVNFVPFITGITG